MSHSLKRMFSMVVKSSKPSKNKIQNILLGRWVVENDFKKINKKFDQANEDHCGCCFIEPILTPSKTSDEDYYLPFVL